MSRILGIVLLASFGIGGGIWYWFAEVNKNEGFICDRTVDGIARDVPLELAAMLDRNCAAVYVAQSEAPVRTAFDLNYPSLAYNHVSQPENVDAVIESAVTQGDRGFFMSDPAILDMLEEGEVADFVRTIFDPATANNAATLHVLPLWQSPENAAQFLSACKNIDCTEDKTICPTRVGLADKLRLAGGDVTLADIVNTCKISFDWILALRRAGLLDTTCSSTLQVNRITGDPSRFEEPCFGSNFSVLAEPAVSNDLVRLIQQKGIITLDGESLKVLARSYPKAADFLATQTTLKGE